MEKFVQLLISGIATGSIYGLIALGFVLIYKATDVFNFAHGEVMMLGAIFAVLFYVQYGLPFALVAVIVIAIAALIGVLIQLSVVRPMLGESLLAIVMVTLGLSLIIRAVSFMVFGTGEHLLPTPFPNRVLIVAGFRMSSLQLVIIGVSALCLLAFAIFFTRSTIGLQMRATAENFEAAVLSGVNAHRVFTTALALGGALAALGGVLFGQVSLVNVHLGEVGLLAALPAIVIGGMTSIPGSIVGGLVVGVLQSMGAGYIGGGAGAASVWLALLLVLVFRPYGLFGEPEITRV